MLGAAGLVVLIGAPVLASVLVLPAAPAAAGFICVHAAVSAARTLVEPRRYCCNALALSFSSMRPLWRSRNMMVRASLRAERSTEVNLCGRARCTCGQVDKHDKAARVSARFG